MASIEKKSLDTPDETRKFGHGKVDIAKVGGVSFGRATFEPGWKWSNDVKPIAKTDWCMFNHSTFIISGTLHVKLNDGSEAELKAGEVGYIPAGHDAWVVGDEPVVAVDVDEIGDYAMPSET